MEERGEVEERGEDSGEGPSASPARQALAHRLAIAAGEDAAGGVVIDVEDEHSDADGEEYKSR